MIIAVQKGIFCSSGGARGCAERRGNFDEKTLYEQ